jgi:hypothetical protein
LFEFFVAPPESNSCQDEKNSKEYLLDTAQANKGK